MYDSREEPCCIAHVTSGGRDEHEPDCREALPAALSYLDSDVARGKQPSRILTASRQKTILSELAERGAAGITVAELRTAYPEMGDNNHHGSWSGSLSLLHKSEEIARLAEQRNGCKVYVHRLYVLGRETEPQGYAPSGLEALLDHWLSTDEASVTGKTTSTRARKYPQAFIREVEKAWREHQR